MIIQDKNKYDTPKYRFVVRVTNRDVICQIVAADLTHDVVLASAYSHELRRYGITLGLTNYAACYATGLLLARRVNAKFNLSYEGKTEVDGEYYSVSDEVDEEAARPFKAVLDIGLARTTTGARIFGALKGAVDGGLDVPHGEGRFPGSSRDNKAGDAEVHRKYIFGQHVADYMRQLAEDDEEAYNRQFKRYVEADVSADDVEELYTKAHAAIRAEPNRPRADSELGYFSTRSGPKQEVVKKSFKKYTKTSRQQKASRVAQKLQNMHKAAAREEEESA